MASTALEGAAVLKATPVPREVFGITHRRDVYASFSRIMDKFKYLFNNRERARDILSANNYEYFWDLLFELDAYAHRVPFNFIKENFENAKFRIYVKPFIFSLLLFHFGYSSIHNELHLSRRNLAQIILFVLPFTYSFNGPFPPSILQFLQLQPWVNPLLTVMGRWAIVGLLLTYMSRFFPNVLGLPANITGKGISKANPNLFVHPYKFIFAPAVALEKLFYNYIVEPRSRKVQQKWNLVWSGEMGKIYIGEILNDPNELPPNIDIILDLTNEFEESPEIVKSCKEYYCEPVWDQQYPMDIESYADKIKTVATKRGNIYVHCQVGRGRSANAVVFLLIARGIANTVEEAYNIVLTARPQIGPLNKERRQQLEKIAHVFSKNQSPWNI